MFICQSRIRNVTVGIISQYKSYYFGGFIKEQNWWPNPQTWPPSSWFYFSSLLCYPVKSRLPDPWSLLLLFWLKLLNSEGMSSPRTLLQFSMRKRTSSHTCGVKTPRGYSFKPSDFSSLCCRCLQFTFHAAGWTCDSVGKRALLKHLEAKVQQQSSEYSSFRVLTLAQRVE